LLFSCHRRHVAVQQVVRRRNQLAFGTRCRDMIRFVRCIDNTLATEVLTIGTIYEAVQVKERDGYYVLSLPVHMARFRPVSAAGAADKHLPIGGIGLSFKNYQHPRRAIPATISVIVAVLLMSGCAYLVRYRFRDPEIETTAQAEHSTTVWWHWNFCS
jgi:hypothetical protein